MCETFLTRFYLLQTTTNDEGRQIEHDSAEEEEEEEVETIKSLQQAAGLYTGPLDVVDIINIFDFDSTLFFTPDPAAGREEYQKKTGKEIDMFWVFSKHTNKLIQNTNKFKIK